MAPMILNALPDPGFPIVVLLGDDQVLAHASGRAAVVKQQAQPKQDVPKPLNLRWFGYGTDAAKEYWDWLAGGGRQAEIRFLLMHLVFPLFYGGALAASLWWVWETVGRPFHPAWIVAPLAMVLTADWTENLIQVAQLRHYVPSNEGRIQNLWLQISCCATMIKLWLTLGLYVSLVGLVVRMIFTLSDRRMAADAAE